MDKKLETSPENKNPEVSPEEENPPQQEQEIQEPSLAEGVDKDDRFEKIKDELKKDWGKDTGKSITSEEGQDFVFGNSAVQREGKKIESLDDRAKEVFTERFPDDAKEYAEKEKTRIYENPADDPAVKQVEEDIARITNQNFDFENAQSLDGWDKNFARANVQQWGEFLNKYPEKAAAYQKTFEPVKRAIEGRERLNKFNEGQEQSKKEEAETKRKMFYTDPALIDYTEDPENGALARLKKDVPLEELAALSSDEYRAKADSIREQMTKEFISQRPDIVAKYGIEVEQTQENGLEVPKKERTPETQEKIEVEPTNPEQKLARRIQDLREIDEAKKNLQIEQTPESIKKEGENFFMICSSMEKPHRFIMAAGTLKQRSLEIQRSDKMAVVNEQDLSGQNIRRWEISKDGNVKLTNVTRGTAERDVPAGRFMMKEAVPTADVKTEFGAGAAVSLKELFYQFLDNVTKKLEASKIAKEKPKVISQAEEKLGENEQEKDDRAKKEKSKKKTVTRKKVQVKKKKQRGK